MFHMDDHFTIPDAYHLEAEEVQGMVDMLPAIKERYQRFQVRSSPRHQAFIKGRAVRVSLDASTLMH